MQKIILGFTGLIASGKGTAAKYLQEKYGAETFRFSTILRDVLDRLYLPQSRENMINLSTNLRENFGQDLLSKVIAQDASRAKTEIVVVDGMRRPADIKDLKEVPGFKMIAIEVDSKVRYERLVKRAENPGDTEKTYDEFLEDHKAETEITIPDLIKQADAVIYNNVSLEDLYKQLDELIK